MTMWGAQTTIGPLYIVFLLWLELLLIISLITIYKDYRQTIDPLRKIQGKYIVAAILIPLTVGTLTDGILPIFHINIFPAAIPLSSIMSMLIGYAILKYGLFEMSFENLLTSMKIPIFTLGMNSSIIMMNESAISLLKLNPRSLHTVQLDKIIKDLTKRNGRQLSIKQKIKQVFLEARPAKLKGVRLIKSTGEKIDVEMHALPVISENQINAVNIVLYTGQPDKSAFEKNEIIGIASHEIKTPLASIRLIAEMLQKTASDKHDLISYEYLNKMNVQLNNMTNLINDFMDVSRIEKGKLLLQKERLNCREFLIDIVEMMQRLAGGKTITWELQPLMYIHADKNRMSQVMMNIISNAIKYSPEGTIIAVRAYREESAVCIEVEDQGDGIQKKDQANIFKSYYRTKRHAGSSTGLGMGLYISKKIITAHKGKIELESKPGKGSLFRIYLPDDT
jgi:signal transduction histidine kinase